MEIILLKDVEYVGDGNTIVDVKPGYARNYLIPQGFAIVANEGNRSALSDQIEKQKEIAAKKLDAAKQVAEKASGTTLRIPAKAGTSGKIFGSVTNVTILQALKEQLGVETDRKSVVLVEEVKMLGTYVARVKLHKEVVADVKFEVFDDKE